MGSDRATKTWRRRSGSSRNSFVTQYYCTTFSLHIQEISHRFLRLPAASRESDATRFDAVAKAEKLNILK
jgi:hypothetical protein